MYDYIPKLEQMQYQFKIPKENPLGIFVFIL